MSTIRARKREQGVSILLVAVCLAALMAMAALAIDVVTLYVARTEAQRAADAGALAGARMIAGSGYTSSSASFNQSDICQSSGPGASAAANEQAEAVVAQNLVAGQPAAVKTISCTWGQQDVVSGNFMNPQITVTVQRTNLPTFFARIWGRTASSVSASSTAEAYNPAGSPSQVPISVSGVKPWLVPNCDPTNTTGVGNPLCPGSPPLLLAANGSIENTGASSPVGRTIVLTHVTGGTPTATSSPPLPSPQPYYSLNYYRLAIPVERTQHLFCPSTNGSCDQVGSSDYHDNIACYSTNPTDTSYSTTAEFTCGQKIGVGQSVTVLPPGGNAGAETNEGTQCLIHAGGAGLCNGQDTFTPNGGSASCAAGLSPTTGTPPVTIGAGDNNPNPALQGLSSISRSDSVVTVPIYQGGNLVTGTGTIVGFMQLAITQNVLPSNPPPPTTGAGSNGKIEAVILNISGCNSPSGTPPTVFPVTGGAISAVPVRLVCIPNPQDPTNKCP